MRAFSIIQNALTVLDRMLGRAEVGRRTFTRSAPESEPPAQFLIMATPEPTANDALIYASGAPAENVWLKPEFWGRFVPEALSPQLLAGPWVCGYCGRPNFADRLHRGGCGAGRDALAI